jgi:PAS domain-containing protein
MMNEKTQLGSEFLQAIVDAFPDLVFIMDENQCVVACNKTAYEYINEDSEKVLRKPKGDVLHCLNAINSPDGCGSSALCNDCVINNSLTEALGGGRVVRARTKIDVVSGSRTEEANFLVTASPFAHNGDNYAMLILEDVNELIQLKKILPICMSCKKIRNDQQYWDNIDSYFEKFLDLSFSHGLCPECMHELYPEFDEDDKPE